MSAKEPPSEGKPLRVCVLNCSYEGSDSPMKEFDDFCVGPHHHFPTDDPRVRFTVKPVTKALAWKTVKDVVGSGQFDAFYNMCDGTAEEDRAGVEVVAALEHFKVPFTGSGTVGWELNKLDQKMIAYYNHVETARFAHITAAEIPGGSSNAAAIMALTREKCKGLKFPLLIKHPLGYSSVGCTADCKVLDMNACAARTAKFVADWQEALIEEFIAGDECTVLVCADPSERKGAKVFLPVKVAFPPGEDWKHFDLKWKAFDGMEWSPFPDTHPAFDKLIEATRICFKVMQGGVGIARADFRIHAETNEPYFLELNSNPGMMYPEGQEASADWIVKLDPTTSHQDFTMLQLRVALANNAKRVPLYKREYDSVRGYLVRATRDIHPGEIVFNDEGTPVRIVTLPHVVATWDKDDQKVFAESAWPLGINKHFYATWDADPAKWRPFNHSCDPNLGFGPNRSLNAVARRFIPKGEELTMDYADICDNLMPDFECECEAECCRRTITCSVPNTLLPDRLSPISVESSPEFYTELAKGKRLMPTGSPTSRWHVGRAPPSSAETP